MRTGYDTEKTQAPIERDDRVRGQEHCLDQITGGAMRSMTRAEILREIFSYHPPTEATLPKYAAINQAAKNFAEVVLQNCPGHADLEIAIDYIRAARMFANAAISLNGLSL
jgi:hypothetical protein